MSKMVESTNYLDPEFVREMQSDAVTYDEKQAGADECKWKIAARVNAMWDEHKTVVYENSNRRVFETKADYYIACSFAANQGLKHKRFCDSGETLRRWCEVQDTYSQFDHAELFLEALSFEHLRVAKSVSYRLEKEQSKNIPPVVMLATAQDNNWNADEMQEHYNPYHPPHPYDAMRERLVIMQDKSHYPFLKKLEDIEYCIQRAKEIDARIKQAIQAEGKAL
jgi:hypothetical protein